MSVLLHLGEPITILVLDIIVQVQCHIHQVRAQIYTEQLIAYS